MIAQHSPRGSIWHKGFVLTSSTIPGPGKAWPGPGPPSLARNCPNLEDQAIDETQHPGMHRKIFRDMSGGSPKTFSCSSTRLLSFLVGFLATSLAAPSSTLLLEVEWHQTVSKCCLEDMMCGATATRLPLRPSRRPAAPALSACAEA